MEEEKISKRQLILVGIAVLLTGILLIVKPTYSVFQVNKTINIMDAKVGDFGDKGFIKSFGGSDFDYFYGVTQTTDSGYAAVGQSYSTDGDLTGLNKGGSDAVIVKYDSGGNVLWNKNFGGSNPDCFMDVVATTDGGYIAVGVSGSNDGDLVGLNKGGTDAIIVKYDSGGNVLWTKNFGGTSNEQFEAVKATTDGGYIAVGTSLSTNGDLVGLNNGSSDAIIVKYDSNGIVQWKKNYGGSIADCFSAVQVAFDGGYIAVGDSNSTDGDLAGLNKGRYDAIIVKYDSNGIVQWKRNYGGSGNAGVNTYDDYFYGVSLTSDGGYIGVGSSGSTDGDLTGLNKGNNDGIIVKYDSGGGIVWKKNFGGSGQDYFASTVTTADGSHLIVGNSYSNNGNLTGLKKGISADDAIIAKYDDAGNVIWNKNYGGSSGDNFNSVAPTADGFVAVGSSGSTDDDLTGLSKGGGPDAIIVKGKFN